MAILAEGTRETEAFFAAQAGRDDARRVLLGWLDHAATDLRDRRAAGFVRAVSAVGSEPDVAAALRAEADAAHAGLTGWAARAVRQPGTRTDLAPEQLARWLAALVDAWAVLVADGADAEVELAVLTGLAHDLLAPR